MLGIADHGWQADSCVQQAVAPFFEHGLVDVGVDHAAAGPNLWRESQGQIARTTRNVQHLLALFDVGHQHCVGLPGAVQTHGHQVVHDVVLGGYRVEHAAHPARLVLLVN